MATASEVPAQCWVVLPKWKRSRLPILVAVVLGILLFAVAATEEQCGLDGTPACAGRQTALLSERQTDPADPTDPEDSPSEAAPPSPTSAPNSNETKNKTQGKSLELRQMDTLGMISLAMVLALLVFVILWIIFTIKYALDGSLPARLALWGVLPEAYAVISVTSAAALLKLKVNPTPVIVLRNCVTDENAGELADAIRKYGKQADLEVIELPYNPALGPSGVREILEACRDLGRIQEYDFSYNPQLSDGLVDQLVPLLKAKPSQLNTLRLAESNLDAAKVEKLAGAAVSSGLRQLDLSYCELGGAGDAICSILEAPVLEDLTLVGCGLTLADVEAIADMLPYTSLRALQLGSNNVGSEGIELLAAKLPSCHIDELGLEGNDLEASHLAPLATAWAKRPFSRVKLTGNRLSQEEVNAFVRTLRTMR